jgi:uncharacterized lipoprotein YmbA
VTVNRTRRKLLLSLAGLAAASGCASPNPNLYTLAPVPGAAVPGGPATVVLHQVAIARYLERPEIVRSSENYRLDVLANDAWGEPLAQMIGRVLADDLSQRLPGTTVLNINGAITAREDATVEVNVQRMDRDAAGALAFVAQASVERAQSSGSTVTRTLRTSIPIASSATAEEVRAMSIALGQLADTIADMLRRAPASRRRRS